MFVCWLIASACSFKKYSRQCYARAEQEKPFDVIVVPGVPYQGAETTPIMNMRMHWAKHLFDSGFTRNIIFSGSAVYTPYIEAVVMKIMADSLGVNPSRTFVETKAEHSTENVYYSWLMAKDLGFQTIALATDHIQARLLKRFIRKHCPGMRSIPIVPGMMNISEKRLPEINPSTAYVPNFISIKEREGFIKRFRYTLGKRVNDEKKTARKLVRQKKRSAKVSGSQ